MKKIILFVFLIIGLAFSPQVMAQPAMRGGLPYVLRDSCTSWTMNNVACIDKATKVVCIGNGSACVDIGVGSVSDTAYNATSWDGVTDIAPSKNAVRDKFEALAALKGYIWIPAGTMVPITSAGLAVVNQNPNMTDYLAFDGATDEYAGFTLSLEDWDLGTIKAKFIWYASAAMTNAHTVIWGLNCYAASDGDTSDVAFDTGAVTVSDAYVTADETGPIQKTTAATAAITVQGTPAAGDVVYCRVSRDADTDTSTIDAWLVGVKLEYGKTGPTAW